MAVLYGRDLSKRAAPFVETPPAIPTTTPKIVQRMIRLLLQHQDAIAVEGFQSLVMHRQGDEQVSLKTTARLTF